MPSDLGIEDRLRRKMSRPARSKSIAIRFTEQEAKLISAAAKASGVAEREWARAILLEHAQPVQLQSAIFTELIAFRAFANGVLRELATGRPMKDEDFSKRVAEAKKNKHQTAAEVLEQYQPNTEGAE